VIGVDTNVLVRYLLQDDEQQSTTATHIIEGFSNEHPGFISQVVLVETVWVLTYRYKLAKDQIAQTIEILLGARELVVENADMAYLALAAYRSTNAGFADALIAYAGIRSGCQETLTFDKAAGRLKGMRQI